MVRLHDELHAIGQGEKLGACRVGARAVGRCRTHWRGGRGLGHRGEEPGAATLVAAPALMLANRPSGVKARFIECSDSKNPPMFSFFKKKARPRPQSLMPRHRARARDAPPATPAPAEAAAPPPPRPQAVLAGCATRLPAKPPASAPGPTHAAVDAAPRTASPGRPTCCCPVQPVAPGGGSGPSARPCCRSGTGSAPVVPAPVAAPAPSQHQNLLQPPPPVAAERKAGLTA